ncbi:hypothetical protein ACK3SF_03240 [Candidatus Nanosalina sp. VS9-1]|uniref:hypothetical protein n=1 Tax=Candidatus Nanosalina sp. VS9-1 TaxID=3388566 RepID=UPI0039E01AD1
MSTDSVSDSGENDSAVSMSYPLTRTGFEADIAVVDVDEDAVSVQISMDEAVYDKKNIIATTEAAIDASGEEVKAAVGEPGVHVQMEDFKHAGAELLNYIDSLDREIAATEVIGDSRNEAVVDAVELISSQGLGAQWTEQLPYTGLGVDIQYHGTSGDENFTYSFNEWMYDDFDGELEKAALEAVGPEEVDMNLENPRQASVSVEADDITEAVEDVYDHLEAVDNEYAAQSEDSYSREEIADELDELMI